MTFDNVWFLSDYGLEDEFVGVVKAVIRAIAPHATVGDVTHSIPAHDIRAGALALARSMQYLTLVPSVVLAVIDPGVCSSRRAVAVEAGGENGDHPGAILVGPDNGLLAPAVAMAGGARRAVSLTNEDYHLPAPGPTFAGRDIFAPAAAHLCAGVDLAELGELIDPALLLPAVLPVTDLKDDELVCEVL
ncbi:MAG: SAM-dependent chlorinase/fluorinase, partial [Acidimicrobiales bacterium]|nr:SAM-dependent chlorinase/fluorinase [Acidimicrobiales bacterium]